VTGRDKGSSECQNPLSGGARRLAMRGICRPARVEWQVIIHQSSCSPHPFSLHALTGPSPPHCSAKAETVTDGCEWMEGGEKGKLCCAFDDCHLDRNSAPRSSTRSGDRGAAVGMGQRDWQRSINSTCL
jgi:hypothetical protein